MAGNESGVQSHFTDEKLLLEFLMNSFPFCLLLKRFQVNIFEENSNF